VTAVVSPIPDLAESPFRCPRCGARIHQSGGELRCEEEHPVECVDGIPILIRDYRAIRAAIAEAEAAGRTDWYEAQQATQFSGPYRHHVRKRRAYVTSVLERFAAARPGVRTGLDLGCGDGEHLGWLAGHVTELYGSDYNVLRLRRAQARGSATVVLADVTAYPAADDAFDVIFFNHVLEHVQDDLAALREVRRILSPGGLVVLGTPNEGAAFWRLAYALQPESRRSTDHVHFYTARALAARCEEAGFVVTELHPIGWGVPHWRLDSRIRGVKAVDDAFEAVGRRVLRSQATSLYALLTKT
jgi:ubiquinone/menaquinone biosynthesis C-methylase UbiE